jgi:hypothetical protein
MLLRERRDDDARRVVLESDAMRPRGGGDAAKRWSSRRSAPAGRRPSRATRVVRVGEDDEPGPGERGLDLDDLLVVADDASRRARSGASAAGSKTSSVPDVAHGQRIEVGLAIAASSAAGSGAGRVR